MMRLLLLTFCAALSFHTTFAGPIEASLEKSVFLANGKPYVEISLFIQGSSINYISLEDSSKQAKVELTLLLKQNNQILQADKLILFSPKAKSIENLLYLKRWPLQIGKYEIEAQLVDLNNTADTISLIKEFDQQLAPNTLSISDVQLYSVCKASNDANSQFVKNGFYFEPLIFEICPRSQFQLPIYFEVYGADNIKQKHYILHYYVRNKKSQAPMLKFDFYKKRESVVLDPILLHLDVSQLPSGEYELVAEITQKDNTVLTSSAVSFYRANPYWDAYLDKQSSDFAHLAKFDSLTDEQLKYSLKAIAPLMVGEEVNILNYMVKDGSSAVQKSFLISFCERINKERPDYVYEQYMKVAKAVDNSFKSGFGYGFETDRGYIFMRYGKPHDVLREENDNGAYPYEIWSYNQLNTGQSHVKFLFYNPSLADNDFRLLHSTAIGERRNDKWEVELYKSVPDEISGDNSRAKVRENVNRKAKKYFDEF